MAGKAGDVEHLRRPRGTAQELGRLRNRVVHREGDSSREPTPTRRPTPPTGSCSGTRRPSAGSRPPPPTPEVDRRRHERRRARQPATSPRSPSNSRSKTASATRSRTSASGSPPATSTRYRERHDHERQRDRHAPTRRSTRTIAPGHDHRRLLHIGSEQRETIPRTPPHDRIPGDHRSGRDEQARRQGLGGDGERIRGQDRSALLVPLPRGRDSCRDLGNYHLHRRQLGLHRRRELRADHRRAGRHGHDRDEPRALRLHRLESKRHLERVVRPWSGSYVFIGTPTHRSNVGFGGADWGANAVDFRGKNGQRYLYSCPAKGEPRRRLRHGTYTDDSSVCSAAVHAGLITVATGGDVTIEIRPGAASYTGSLATASRVMITTRGREAMSSRPGSYPEVRTRKRRTVSGTQTARIAASRRGCRRPGARAARPGRAAARSGCRTGCARPPRAR